MYIIQAKYANRCSMSDVPGIHINYAPVIDVAAIYVPL